MFAFVCLTLLLPLLSIYSFVSISGQNAIFSCKDAAATTIAVKLFYKNNNYVVVIDIEDFILLTGIISPTIFCRQLSIRN